jgi:hypothetical protein
MGKVVESRNNLERTGSSCVKQKGRTKENIYLLIKGRYSVLGEQELLL